MDPEVNKIVSCRKKYKKIFHALQNVDMHTCYAKQNINLPCRYDDKLLLLMGNLS